MERKKIDAYIIQETHLEGNFMKYLTGDKIMIHHGPSIQPRGARGGVAIILSSNLTEGWKEGGYVVKRGGETIGGTTRLMRVDIKIRDATKINIRK